MPEQNKRQHSRAIMEVLIKERLLEKNDPEAIYSDGIRTMKDFLVANDSCKSKMDVLEAMLHFNPGDTMLYPEEVQNILNSIDAKLQFNMRYFSYLSAQEIGLTDRPCDISRTGMSFPSAINANAGSRILIRALMPLDPPFISSLVLDVAWCRSTPDRVSLPFRIGGSFQFRNDLEKIVVSRLIQHYMP